nr:MAG: hypothetical protein [Lokiarchaeota virus Skoll Meg22_1214]
MKKIVWIWIEPHIIRNEKIVDEWNELLEPHNPFLLDIEEEDVDLDRRAQEALILRLPFMGQLKYHLLKCKWNEDLVILLY